jgi:DNA-binding PadR family transcriptional regulator
MDDYGRRRPGRPHEHPPWHGPRGRGEEGERAHHGPFRGASFRGAPFAGWFGAGFGARGRGGFGPPPWAGERGGRARRGDVRFALLALLAERPMHGYEMIQELDTRTSGAWRPSPGSVYPTLQLLEDEGLVSVSEVEGRRTYSITDAGREALAERGDRLPPWEEVTAGLDPSVFRLGDEVRQLLGAAFEVGRNGSAEQRQQAETIVAEARRRLYGILAEQ